MSRRTVPLTLNSDIGKFPPSSHKELCSLLDIDQTWKKLAQVLPHRNGSGERFTTDEIMNFVYKPNPSETLLSAWKTDFVTFGTLIHWLNVAGLKRHACLVRKAIDQSFVESPDCIPCLCETCNVRGPTTTSYHPSVPTSTHQTSPTGDCCQISYSLLSAWTKNFNMQPVNDGGYLLGHGGYADVFKAFDPNLGRLIAVKRMKDKDSSNQSKYSPTDQLLNEIKVLANLNHDNIVKLLGCSTDGPYLCVLYEYVSCGSLEDCLACRNSQLLLTAPQRISIIDNCARGLAYLHRQNYVHMDVKSANILLDGDLMAKIGDYGTTRPGPSVPGATSEFTGIVIGTTVYIAPEILAGGRISFKADSYSFGVVILEILTGLASFDSNREDRNLVYHVQQNCSDDEIDILDETVDDWWRTDPQQVYKLARRLLSHYEIRPLIEKVLNEIDQWTHETLVKC